MNFESETLNLILIILFPFLAALAGYFFRKGNAWPHLLGAGGSLFSALLLWIKLGKNGTARLEVMRYGEFSSFLFADFTSALLVTVVGVVSFFIFIYAKGYMRHDTGKTWFWPAISLFLMAMQLLVLAGDWFLFITGWEIMGLASFLLIGTWHHKKEARQGATKAFLLTRFSDIGLYAGAFLVIITFGDLAIPASGEMKVPLAASLWLLLAVMGKSAQVPFQDWLSGAMAGPTPVSALLHSATMVGAGALLLIRIFPVLPEQGLDVIAIIGVLTIVLTGITAISSRDIKQMLAASTSSQFGFILLAVGTGFPGAALAHWLAHAFMKSSLFLGAGIFQHARGDTLYEKLKGSGKHLKITFFGFAIAGFALAGIPPLIGYYSKDALLAAYFKDGNGFYMTAALIGVLFTATYVAKALNRLWNGKTQKPEIKGLSLLRSGLLGLVFIVLLGGFFLEKLVLSGDYIFPKDSLSKYLGLGLTFLGLLMGWVYREKWLSERVKKSIGENYPVFGGYQKLIVQPVLWLADVLSDFDRKISVFVQNIGRAGLFFSRKNDILDKWVNRATWAIGISWLIFSKINKIFDDKILKGVENIGYWTLKTGARGKKWQSGMVHKELAISVVALLILIFILTASIFTL
ncbi:NADH-quinone oxidoreductase subunit L [Gillisia sp. Hel_I_86]|uniref:NADH-quinone oxidoreductase subunit 5 family protein n=1 Tax=Gillisia sp. Hel_I_86 TaxID=1249981 RepID=UPI00119B7DCF|nr:NADH-quinone oxidoreductase subunit L [Gillisia sp. Hel_I_86]TVZ28633.1 NADH-quinone oxidoreductase subunit L [Gillisia sp. Hel_I_86]